MTLEEIKKARAAITPGPWGKLGTHIISENQLGTASFAVVWGSQPDKDEFNAEFIARAPGYIDFLIEQVEQMREALEWIKSDSDFKVIPTHWKDIAEQQRMAALKALEQLENKCFDS